MKNNAGFTLIEIIAVLVLVGILSAMAGFGLVQGVEGYLFAKNNAATTQKAQLALERISRELAELSAIDSTSSGTAIIFSNPAGSRKIGLAGSTIKWAAGSTLLPVGDILIEDVYGTNGFTVKYYDANNTEPGVASFSADPKQLARIDVTLLLARPDVTGGHLDFSTSVTPRNTGTKAAPTL